MATNCYSFFVDFDLKKLMIYQTDKNTKGASVLSAGKLSYSSAIGGPKLSQLFAVQVFGKVVSVFCQYALSF